MNYKNFRHCFSFLFFQTVFVASSWSQINTLNKSIDSTEENSLSYLSDTLNGPDEATSSDREIRATGSITMETWTNISGTSISSIPVNSSPNSTVSITKLESPKDVGDNFGRRIRGYIYPPASGNYFFWIASNNTSELWLSTTNLPQDKEKIASVGGWTDYRQWTKYSSQKSASKYLVAGQKLYRSIA